MWWMPSSRMRSSSRCPEGPTAEAAGVFPRLRRGRAGVPPALLAPAEPFLALLQLARVLLGSRDLPLGVRTDRGECALAAVELTDQVIDLPRVVEVGRAD